MAQFIRVSIRPFAYSVFVSLSIFFGYLYSIAILGAHAKMEAFCIHSFFIRIEKGNFSLLIYISS